MRKPDKTEAMVRREFLAAMASAAAVGRPWEHGAREIVRSGELGEVTLCRIRGSGGERAGLRRFLEYALDGTPRVVSYERARDGGGGVWIYGSEGTLRVSGNGLQVWSGDGRFKRI